MGEATVDQKALEDAILKALPCLLSNLHGTTNNARVDFYDKFQRAADDYDRDFIKKYDEDLDTTLIFAGLFSAVTSAFIIDVQSNLEPDFQEMNHALLKILASVALGNVPTGADAVFPQWSGPDSAIVRVQAILYSSLAASLLAAFIAMLGKQWLNRYAQMEMRASVIDRSRHRQCKMNGMVTWRFDLVMECLPLMLQIALLLLGYALSDYLFFINKVIAGVLIGFTTFGLLFYFLIVSAATLSYDCPFQTPLSLIIRFLVRYDNEHKELLKKSRRWFGRIFSQKMHKMPTPGGPVSGNAFHDHIELPVAGPPGHPPPLFTKDADWDSYILDYNCIAWMFEMSVDSDFVTAIMRFIPEVVWHAGIRTPPLDRAYDTLLGCFDHSSGRPVVIPKLRDKAYLSAKAVLHLTIQRKCIDDESYEVVFNSISNRHPVMGFKRYEDDSDLESTLGIIDHVFGNSEPIRWQDFSFTTPHHAWMAHIFLYRAWDALRKGEHLPDDVKGFIHHSVCLEPSPPAPIITDCFFLVGSLLGVSPYHDALLAADRSSLIDAQANRIFEKLEQTFKDPDRNDIYHALEVLVMICHLPNIIPPSMSYKLFQMVMRSPIPETHSEAKWKVCRLTMRGAFEDSNPLPKVEDPEGILAFLDRHFELALIGGQNQDQPIQNALRALASVSSPTSIEALNRFDPTGRLFVRGIRHALQPDRLSKLREAAILFLPRIGNKWFHPCALIMGSTEMKSFCIDWASAVDCLEQTPAVKEAALTILLGMINSPRWRPHIVSEKWGLLEHFMLIPGDLHSLRVAINDSDLMDGVRNVDNPRAVVLWAEILWFKYGELIPMVREQLETVTKEIAQNERGKSQVDKFLSNANSELRKVEDALGGCTLPPTDPVVIVLRERIGMLQRASQALEAIRLGGTPSRVPGVVTADGA